MRRPKAIHPDHAQPPLGQLKGHRAAHRAKPDDDHVGRLRSTQDGAPAEVGRCIVRLCRRSAGDVGDDERAPERSGTAKYTESFTSISPAVGIPDTRYGVVYFDV
jgi:hypothetical protein